MKSLNDQPITIIQPFTSGYMDLRWFSGGWYHSLELPNTDFTNYQWPFEYQDLANDRRSKIHINFHLINHPYILTYFQVTRILPSDTFKNTDMYTKAPTFVV